MIRRRRQPNPANSRIDPALLDNAVKKLSTNLDNRGKPPNSLFVGDLSEYVITPTAGPVNNMTGKSLVNNSSRGSLSSRKTLLPVGSREALLPVDSVTGEVVEFYGGGDVSAAKSTAMLRAKSLSAIDQQDRQPLLKRTSTTGSLNRSQSSNKLPRIESLQNAAKDIHGLTKNPDAKVADKKIKNVRYGDIALATMALSSLGRDYRNLIPKE